MVRRTRADFRSRFNAKRKHVSLQCAAAKQFTIVLQRSDVAKPEVVAYNFDVNHHFLERDDFDEFIEAWDAAMHLCPDFPEFQDYLPSGGAVARLLIRGPDTLRRIDRGRVGR